MSIICLITRLCSNNEEYSEVIKFTFKHKNEFVLLFEINTLLLILCFLRLALAVFANKPATTTFFFLSFWQDWGRRSDGEGKLLQIHECEGSKGNIFLFKYNLKLQLTNCATDIRRHSEILFWFYECDEIYVALHFYCQDSNELFCSLFCMSVRSR